MIYRDMSSVVDQIRGVSYKPENIREVLDDSSITLLRANNIVDGTIDLSDVVFIDRKCVSDSQILHYGDVLICASSGSKNLVGKAARYTLDGDFTFGAFCKVIRPKNSDTSDYISLFFQSQAYRRAISSVAIGANINNIRNEHIDALRVCWPDIDERMSIVGQLQSVIKVIHNRKCQLKVFDDFIKARFVEMFGDESNPFQWQIINVEDVADVTVGVVVKPAQYYTDAEHGVKAFRSLNIGQMVIKDEDWVYFSYEGNDKNAKSQLKENDLLLVRSGAPGTACVVPKQYEGCNAIDIIIARPNTKMVNPYFLCAYTNMPHGKRQIEEGTGGAAQQHFNVGRYNKLRLMLPPLKLQNAFADFISQVDKSKVVAQKALDKTQHLFDSLMQKYFG